MKKLNRETREELAGYAKRLPVMFQDMDVVRTVRGEQILDRNPLARDRNGEPIVAHRKYSRLVTDKVPVDHFKRMCRLFKTAGMKAVEQYVLELVDFHLETQEVDKIGGVSLMRY